jgi:hypothetical protein
VSAVRSTLATAVQPNAVQVCAGETAGAAPVASIAPRAIDDPLAAILPPCHRLPALRRTGAGASAMLRLPAAGAPAA